MILSFDDGYSDFVEHAVPLLDRYGIRVNQNVIGSCVVDGRAPWNVELYDRLVRVSPARLRTLRVRGFERQIAGEDSDALLAYGLSLSIHLKLRPRSERLPLLEEILAHIGDEGLDETSPTRMLDAEQIRALAADGHEIGSHSYSHESMGFESDEFFIQDFERARTFFRDDLRLPLDTYAFPNGSYRPTQIDILHARGVKHVLLVGERVALGRNGVFPRLTHAADSAPEARLRAVGIRARGFA